MARTDYAPLGRSDGDSPSTYARGYGRSRNRECDEEDRYGEGFGNRDRGRRIAIDETTKLIASNKAPPSTTATVTGWVQSTISWSTGVPSGTIKPF